VKANADNYPARLVTRLCIHPDSFLQQQNKLQAIGLARVFVATYNTFVAGLRQTGQLSNGHRKAFTKSKNRHCGNDLV
jgi:hypothetical protein